MRVFLIVILLVIVAGALGVLAVGLFPPKPHEATVQHVIPNDKLGVAQQ